ncbi:helix-turn-helix domain-containing protein [Paenibacillus aestuarii]|uniref:Helix-turn-helix transcriptional regulator n=1 Tax=Paenibacillus aestuarii TaxID=516965 RepID=A0ABW0K8Q0_9BACL|nr:helix-turn-helix transcriptional regulator [Paenibacillus aestuarii]
MEFPNNFGKFLEELRGKMSLRKAADKSGLSHAYIRDLELGRNRATNDVIRPSPDTLRKLSQAYLYPYKDMLMRAGYLEEEHQQPLSMKDQLANIWYVEFGVKHIRYYSPEQIAEEIVESLVEFTDLLEIMQDNDYLKLDTHLFVNMNKIKKYAPAEGKLYFDAAGEGPYVTIAALPQKKYHQLIISYVARNTGQQPDIEQGTSTLPLNPKFFS